MDRSHSDARWLVLTVESPPTGEEILMLEALRRSGAYAVEREGGQMVGLFPPDQNPDEVVRRASGAIRASTSLREPRVTWRRWSEAEWASAWVRPAAGRVGRHIVLVPNGLEPPARQGDTVIRLVPGVAFGTGEHATTRRCLRWLEEFVRSGDRVADVGAGSAILAIAAARLGARQVLALERDRHACTTARRNVRANGVEAGVEVRRLEVTPRILGRLGRFDGVVANLQAEVLLPLLPAFRAALRPGGWLIISGVIRPEVHEVTRATMKAGLVQEDQTIDDGWWTGWFQPAGSAGSSSRSDSSTSPGPSPIASRTCSSTSAHTSSM